MDIFDASKKPLSEISESGEREFSPNPGCEYMGTGQIHRVYQACCARCGSWQDLEARTKQKAEKELRVLGWSKTIEHGWMCVECLTPPEPKPFVEHHYEDFFDNYPPLLLACPYCGEDWVCLNKGPRRIDTPLHWVRTHKLDCKWAKKKQE